MLSCCDRDLVLVEGEGIFVFFIGLILSIIVGEFDFGVLFVGDIVNVGVFCVWVFGDLVDDFEEVIVLLLLIGCDDGEISGDILSDEDIVCMMLYLLMIVFDINYKE